MREIFKVVSNLLATVTESKHRLVYITQFAYFIFLFLRKTELDARV